MGYLISRNIAEAYMEAYPGCKNIESAERAGKRLLEEKEIQELVKNAETDINEKKIAGEEEVMAYLTSVMRGEEKDEITIRTGKDCQEIAQIKPDTKDRMKAAELLAKRYGLGEEKERPAQEGAVFIREDLE